MKRWQQGLGELYVVTSEAEWESARAALAEADLIVDALLGTGLRGPVEGLLGAVIEDLNAARREAARENGGGGRGYALRASLPIRRISAARWWPPISP